MITVKTADLVTALKKVAASVGSNTRLPVLSNVLLNTEKNNLVIQCNDLTTATRVSVPCIGGVNTALAFAGLTVQHKMLLNYIKLVDHDTVDLDVDTKTMTLTMSWNSNSATLRGIDADEAPSPDMDSASYTWFATLPASVLASAIKTGLTATSVENPRLDAIALRPYKDTLRVYAIDGYRMAMATLDKDTTQVDRKSEVIIPSDIARSLLTLLIIADPKASVEIFTNQRALLVTVGVASNTDIFYAGSLQDECVQNLERFTDVPTRCAWTVDRAALERCIKVVHAAAKASAAVDSGVLISYENNQMVLTFQGSDNTMKSACDAQIIEGIVPGSSGMNSHYMLEAIKTFTGNTITVKRIGDTSKPIGDCPLVFSSPDDLHVYLIMGVRPPKKE